MVVSYTAQRVTPTVSELTAMPLIDDRNDACVRRSHDSSIRHFELRRHDGFVCTINPWRTSTHQLNRTKSG